jgi:OmpA-OmpF porin, OOP family
MRIRTTILAGVFLLATGSAAEAQVNTGFYGGLGIGKSKAKLKAEDFSLRTAGIEENRDEVDTAYKFFGGYQFTQYLGAELSYTDFGKFAYIYNATPVGLGQSRVNYKAASWAVSSLGRIPLGQSGFSLTGRLGVAFNRAERSGLTGGGFSTSPAIPSATKRGFGLLWGAGGQYDFTPALSMRLEFEDYGKFGESQSNTAVFPQQTGRATIHMYSLNFIARF